MTAGIQRAAASSNPGKHRRNKLRRVRPKIGIGRDQGRRARRSAASLPSGSLPTASSWQAASRWHPWRHTPGAPATHRSRKIARDRSNRKSPSRGRPSSATRRRRGRRRRTRSGGRCCGPSVGAPGLEGAKHWRSGCVEEPSPEAPMPSAGRKPEAPCVSAYPPAPIRGSPPVRCRPLRRPSGQARGRCRRSGRSRRALVDLRAGRLRARPARAAHTAWTSAADAACSYWRMPYSSGHSAAGSAVGERALNADLDHLGREAVGIDPGDEQSRGVGLAKAKQQPRPLGDPVDRDARWAGACGPWRASASRSAMWAQREAIGVCIRRISDRSGTLRPRFRTGRRAKPRVGADRVAP